MKMLDQEILHRIKSEYDNTTGHLLFLDYDGTLVPFASRPDKAIPGNEVIGLLEELSSNEKNTIVIISGRDRAFLEKAFGNLDVTLVAEHGFFIREPGMDWRAASLMENHWKEGAREVFSRYQEMFPGSFVEEKETAMAWHYRNCEMQPSYLQIVALRLLLIRFTKYYSMGILEGNKVVEVREKHVNKGSAAKELLKEHTNRFILAIGDDRTDEDLFMAMPEYAFTIKVGGGSSAAKYFCSGQENVAAMLSLLLGKSVL